MNARTCALCETVHGLYEPCHIYNAPYYAFGYEWLTPRLKDSDPVCDEIRWVVPVKDNEEASLVNSYFFQVMKLGCAGASPLNPVGRNEHMKRAGHSWRIFARWAPFILDEAIRWKKEQKHEKHQGGPG